MSEVSYYETADKFFNRLDIRKINGDTMTAMVKEQLGEEGEKLLSYFHHYNSFDDAQAQKALDIAGFAEDQSDLYESFASNFKFNNIVQSYCTADIFRTFAVWILEHRNLFGKKILDIGCGCGALTCFIAYAMPDSEVIGIERVGAMVPIANRYKEILGLSNVKFVNASLDNYAETGFDTYFSSLTVQENIRDHADKYIYINFVDQVNAYEKLFSEYVHEIADHMTEGSRFISIERLALWQSDYYAYLNTLNKCGLKVKFGCCRSLYANELDFDCEHTFTVTAASRKEGYDEERIFHWWQENTFAESIASDDCTKAQLDCFLEANAEKTVYGYCTYSHMHLDNVCQSIYVIYSIRNEPSKFVLYTAGSEDNAMLLFIDKSELDEYKDKIDICMSNDMPTADEIKVLPEGMSFDNISSFILNE